MKDAVHRLLTLSHLGAHLHHAAQRAWHALGPLRDSPTGPRTAGGWTWSVQGPAMVADARRFLAGHVVQEPPPTGLDAVLALLETPARQHLLQLEAEATSPNGQEALQRFCHAPPPEAWAPWRMALAQRVVDATGAHVFQVEMVLSWVEAFLEGTRPPQELDRALRTYREELLDEYHRAAVVFFIYAYRAEEEAPLGVHAEFLETPAGAWWYDATRRAMVHAFSRAGSRFAGPRA